MLTVVALTTLATAFAAVQPLVLQRLVDGIAAHRPIGRPIVLLVVVTLAETCARSATSFASRATAEKLTRDLRTAMVVRLIRAELKPLEKHRRGDLVGRMTADTLMVRQVIASSLVAVYSSVIMICAALVMMALLDAVLTLMTVLVLLVAMLLLAPVTGRLKAANEAYQQSLGLLGGAVDTMLSSMRLLRVYGAQNAWKDQFDRSAEESERYGRRVAALTAMVDPVVSVATQGALMSVLVLGGAALGSGRLTPGELVGYLFYLFLVIVPLGQLAAALAQVQAGRAAMTRISEILELPLEIGGRGKQGPPEKVHGAIVLDRVTYEHAAGRGVYDLSLTLPPASHTAVVGASGAGKSTLLALLARFYEPQSGRIHVAGLDAAQIDLESWRHRIHLVEQDSPAIATTVGANLRLADGTASDVQLRDALTTVGLDPSRPGEDEDLLEKPVGDGGRNLSGGERQRLAWARVAVAPRDLVLLDEPTSSVDRVSERQFRDMTTELARRCTVVTVAHRLSTIRSADRIVVLHNGRIAAQGRHEDLVGRCEIYRALLGSATP